MNLCQTNEKTLLPLPLGGAGVVRLRKLRNLLPEKTVVAEAGPERIWGKVKKGENPNDCWIWTGRKAPDGYGRFRHRGHAYAAHRICYNVFHEIPHALVLDHLCRNKGCVNPAHLEPVTHRENLLRSVRLKTCCKHGHEYTPENTRLHGPYLTKRACRTCARNSYHKQKLKRNGLTETNATGT